VDSLGKYLRNLGVGNLKAKTQERDNLRRFLELDKIPQRVVVPIVVIVMITN
jgi:hypothetical protein